MAGGLREIVHPDTTRHCHCIGRRVQRAFPCGQDTFSCERCEHRKHRVSKRLRAFNDMVFLPDRVGPRVFRQPM
jgi:hypothetical protein